ncbi:MAG: ATP-binding protein [Nitrospirae bacterium]|nr:ATP-binding protein [Nitrospirota bacterium]
MVTRQFWIKKIREAWEHKSVLWLSGVRRVGKTSLCQSLPKIEYFDCELPRTRRQMEDSQSFLEDLKGKTVIFDEIHRLDNPSELLKIAADHYNETKILATGSSTLGASRKFRDTLTGRKTEIWLTPIVLEDLHDFTQPDLKHRFLYGGLPPFFLAKTIPERDFQEWMDSYWAKDIQELFRLERRHSFIKFAELVIAQSGGIFEATRFARPCEVSRTTISNYLAVLEATFVAHVIRPFSSHRPAEIISAPKVYAFDTGFICTFKGWNDLRREDMGFLWEHFVLNEIQAHLQTRKILYWRDKRGHEVDFVLTDHHHLPTGIECKWSGSDFDPTNFLAFRRQYPEGNNFVVANDVTKGYSRQYDHISIKFVNLRNLIQSLTSDSRP